MGRPTRQSFLAILFSAASLTPLVLGGLGALVLSLTGEKNRPLAAFVATAGALGSVGSLLTLLLLNGPGLDPVLLRRRKDMLAGLEELADTRRLPASAEAGPPATAAAAERL
jgi:hypothetical protein